MPASRRDWVLWVENTILIKREVFGLLLLVLCVRLVRVLVVAADHLVLNEATFRSNDLLLLAQNVPANLPLLLLIRRGVDLLSLLL